MEPRTILFRLSMTPVGRGSCRAVIERNVSARREPRPTTSWCRSSNSRVGGVLLTSAATDCRVRTAGSRLSQVQPGLRRAARVLFHPDMKTPRLRFVAFLAFFSLTLLWCAPARAKDFWVYFGTYTGKSSPSTWLVGTARRWA